MIGFIEEDVIINSYSMTPYLLAIHFDFTLIRNSAPESFRDSKTSSIMAAGSRQHRRVPSQRDKLAS